MLVLSFSSKLDWGIDILVTSKNGYRKIVQSIRITSRSLSRIKKWNQFSQFRRMSIKVTPVHWVHFHNELRV